MDLQLDLDGLADHDAAADLWDRYKRGERNVFTRRLYTLQGQQAFDDFSNADDLDANFIDLAIQDYYVEALWLLSLTKMLGYDQEIERVVGFYLLDETNIGADELFEAAGERIHELILHNN